MTESTKASELINELDKLGAEIRFQNLLEGMVRLLYWSIFAIVLLFALDYLVHFPYAIRLIAFVGGLGYAGYWFIVNPWKQFNRQLTTEEVSLLVEDRYPEFRSRVISTLQFNRNLPKTNMSLELVSKMMHQTFSMTKDKALSAIVDKTWQKKNFMTLVVSVAVISGVVATQTDTFRYFLKRLVLPVSYPSLTKVTNIEMPEYLVAGEEFTIKVKANGVLPTLGTVSLLTDTDRLDTDLVPIDRQGLYESQLSGIIEDGNIEINLGDFTSEVIPLKVVQRPTIAKMTLSLTPPEYTTLPQTDTQSGNARMLYGTKVKLTIKPNKKLKELKFLNKTTTEKIANFVEKDGVWELSFTPEASMTYTLSMLDDFGLVSKDIPDFRLTVKDDRKPVIRVMKPYSLTELAPQSSLKLEVKIKDDFNLQSVKILYTITNGEYEQDSEFQQFKVKKSFKDIQSNQFVIDEIWSNRKLDLKEGNLLKIRIEAVDNAPTPNISYSEDILVPIISDAEMRSRLSEEFVEAILPVEDLKLRLNKSSRKTSKLGAPNE
ncbi:MAG: hypothetical protein NE330_18990 [Lentisphaeraceae bacterium]|nr:hypothetical protein [Lentisphaeraceae bacterium]